MLLTGKARQDFERWLRDNCDTYGQPMSMGIGCGCGNNFDYEDLYLNIPEFAQTSFIIEWLDSVGIYVEIEPNIGGGVLKTKRNDSRRICKRENA